MNLSLKILQNIMILVFGISSLMHASNSSSSSIAQRLVQAAAGQAASTGQQRVAAPSADNKAQQEDAHNPASAQSSSAGAISEAHLHAIWANLSSSLSNSSSSGSTHPAQASVPNISTDNEALAVLPWSTEKVKAKNPQPDPKRFANYNEKKALEEYEKCKKDAEEFLKKSQDLQRPSAQFYMCTYTGCVEGGSRTGVLNHITHKHVLKNRRLFACLRCAKFFLSQRIRDAHAHGKSNCESSSSSNNSSSSGSAQPAQASIPAISTNNGAIISVASLLPAESGETQAVGQAQSNGKRKKPLRHKKNSSKKQKVEQKESKEYAQGSSSSSASASVAVAATLVASSASSSSSSFHDMHGALAAINPIANPSALLDSLSASAAAQAALHAGDASLLPRDFVPLGHAVQQAAPSEVLLAQQNLDASLPDLALLLEAGLSDSHGSTSAQANAIAQSALPISADDATFGTLAPLPPSSIEHYIDEVDAEKFFGNLG